jgi:hypothetical protein
MNQASLENLHYQFFKGKKRGVGCHGLTTPTKNQKKE